VCGRASARLIEPRAHYIGRPWRPNACRHFEAHSAQPRSIGKPLPLSAAGHHVNNSCARLAVRRANCDAGFSWHTHSTEAIMGDKSPKSKQREQKQKSAVKQQDAANAKAKQTSQAVVVGKDKK
jgi:hypothetical protein